MSRSIKVLVTQTNQKWIADLFGYSEDKVAEIYNKSLETGLVTDAVLTTTFEVINVLADRYKAEGRPAEEIIRIKNYV